MHKMEFWNLSLGGDKPLWGWDILGSALAPKKQTWEIKTMQDFPQSPERDCCGYGKTTEAGKAGKALQGQEKMDFSEFRARRTGIYPSSGPGEQEFLQVQQLQRQLRGNSLLKYTGINRLRV